MRYLLDTNVFLWSLAAKNKLNSKALAVLSSSASQIYFSAASSWEISIKHALGKIQLPAPPSEFIPQVIREMGFVHLDVTSVHALAAGELPPHHRDPFDRMLISQARAEDLLLLTADRTLKQYDVEVLLCGR